MINKGIKWLAATLAAMMSATASAAECALSAPDGDATEMLQKAFADVANTRVALGAGDYVVATTLRIRRPNLEVVLKDGARILAKSGMFRRITEFRTFFPSSKQLSRTLSKQGWAGQNSK